MRRWNNWKANLSSGNDILYRHYIRIPNHMKISIKRNFFNQSSSCVQNTHKLTYEYPYTNLVGSRSPPLPHYWRIYCTFFVDFSERRFSRSKKFPPNVKKTKLGILDSFALLQPIPLWGQVVVVNEIKCIQHHDLTNLGFITDLHYFPRKVSLILKQMQLFYPPENGIKTS